MSGHHKWADIKRKSEKKGVLRKYELTLVFEIEAEDFDAAREMAIHRAFEENAKTWGVEGTLGGLKDQGKADG
jgi:hypothetical protein